MYNNYDVEMQSRSYSTIVEDAHRHGTARAAPTISATHRSSPLAGCDCRYPGLRLILALEPSAHSLPLDFA